MLSFSFYLFQVLVQKVCADANATSPVSARSSNEQSFGVFSLVMFPLSEDLQCHWNQNFVTVGKKIKQLSFYKHFSI